MSTSATDPTQNASAEAVATELASPKSKGKGKATNTDDAMDDDEDDSSDEEDDDEEEEGSDDDEDEDMTEIDPTAIVGRRTRGVKVDYTSAEALNKAGLKKDDEEDDDEDKMKD